MKISDEEYEAIIKEMAERVRDVVFMNAERRVIEGVKSLLSS